MNFGTHCRAVARRIRHGALKEEDDVSQVDERSYEPIAVMNERGFLTHSSQDGQLDERAFVSGFMESTMATEVTHLINCVTDKMFIVIAPGHARSFIPLTRYKGRGVTNIHLYDRKYLHEAELREAGYTGPTAGIVKVIAIDPLWERKAYESDGLWHDVATGLATFKQRKK